ncbi:efflux RND transporter periplasmic adaptor subunit, partial [Paraburkholderia caribensis]
NADAAERSAAAKVQADRASVESARVNLGYTKVTSPITGIAGEQQVTAGTVVGSGVSDAGASGTLLATVQQIDPLYVNFTLSAADLVTLRQAQGAGHVALAGQAGSGWRKGVFLIPQQAIQRDVVGAYAMVVAGGKAQRRNVEASASYGNDW